MTELESYLLSITQVTSLEILWDMHQRRMATYGFDCILYAATRLRTKNGMGDVRDALILSTYPDDFNAEYLDGGLFRDAPMVRWAMSNVGSRSWSEIAADYQEGRLTAGERRVCEFNRRHGIVAGYGISFPRTSERSGHGIGLAARNMTQAGVDELWSRKGQEIELLNLVTHLTILSLPYGTHGRPLTARQREVLELVADGKTVQDVAHVLGRNPATIEKHLRLAREALDVDTTAQAILKASVQNQFYRYEA
ncbi:autoinducer binding domain-containing protein [Jannaschia sp. 2305UL9-9]|uniref:helix-turn-helix transcriptional regulator n=1 Tax=Jannaschia sp. 2305UL9-9 TaxID=3121638 RepID=UPI0035295DCE